MAQEKQKNIVLKTENYSLWLSQFAESNWPVTIWRKKIYFSYFGNWLFHSMTLFNTNRINIRADKVLCDKLQSH
jgi:hypothetical protein